MVLSLSLVILIILVVVLFSFPFFFNPHKEITLLITVVDIIRRLKFSSMEVCDKVIVIHYEFDLLPPK